MQLGMYRHYEGNLYDVIGVAHHSETMEEMVVYRARYDSPDFRRITDHPTSRIRTVASEWSGVRECDA